MGFIEGVQQAGRACGGSPAPTAPAPAQVPGEHGPTTHGRDYDYAHCTAEETVVQGQSVACPGYPPKGQNLNPGHPTLHLSSSPTYAPISLEIADFL